MNKKDTCATSDCNAATYCRGLCEPCYRRSLRFGVLGLVKPVATGKPCLTEGCGRDAKFKGFCSRCYQAWLDSDESRPRCVVPGCQGAKRARGFCSPHYQHCCTKKRCVVSGCKNSHDAKGFCRTHYARWRLHGDPLVSVGIGAPGRKRAIRNAAGETITKHGYRKIRVPDGRWLLEHRWVMEQRLGRPLTREERVHHKDGNKLNNVDSNLELWVKPQPIGVRAADALAWAEDFVRRYSPIRDKLG